MFGKQASKSFSGSEFFQQTKNVLKDEYKNMYNTWRQNSEAKSAVNRQNIIGQHKLDHQNNLEKYKAEFQDGLPKNWGAALESAGGASGAAWRVGASAVAGGVAGGAIDASTGNDSWTDGAMIGGALGGVVGASSFAKKVHGLKVGKFTESSNPVSYSSNGNTVNNNTGKWNKEEWERPPNPFKS